MTTTLGNMKFLHLLLFLLILFCHSANAEWQLKKGAKLNGKPSVRTFNMSKTGARFEIYKTAKNAVMGKLALKKGLFSLDDQSCPTLIVTYSSEFNLDTRERVKCTTYTHTVIFKLGRIDGASIISDSIYALNNGLSASIVFKTKQYGYFKENFTLKGSHKALSKVLGEDVSIIALNSPF